MLDPDIANTNGPAVMIIDGEETLIIGDTSADYFAAPYDSATGVKGERRVFGDTRALDGIPDGSAVDVDEGLWCALVGGGQLARFTDAGLDRTVAVPAANPTDVAFGGPDLDRLYVVSIHGDGDARRPPAPHRRSGRVAAGPSRGSRSADQPQPQAPPQHPPPIDGALGRPTSWRRPMRTPTAAA